jgi:hypothetical protein
MIRSPMEATGAQQNRVIDAETLGLLTTLTSIHNTNQL